jgi:hypothetical protein
MVMNRLIYMSAVLLIALSGCTWVALEDSGKRIRVVSSASEVEGCENKGEITASVRDKVAFVNRDAAKVNDEVEALARNQAAELGADTIRAASELDHGSKRFDAFRCK